MIGKSERKKSGSADLFRNREVKGGSRTTWRFLTSKPARGFPMEPKVKTERSGTASKDKLTKDEMVNDSLGTISPSDSTGVDEDKETGDAKDKSFPTKED
jgi:hypothetical protein